MSDHFLIQNGMLIDGSGQPAIAADVRIRGSKIDEIGPNLAAKDAQIIDAANHWITPGLIDLHVHVFSGVGMWSIPPRRAGLSTGVTCMLDTGTAGALTFPGFQQHVIDHATEDIYALLNISMLGCLQGHPNVEPWMGELADIRHLHVPSAISCLERFPERLIGTKVRLTDALADYQLDNEWQGLRGALAAAQATNTFVMVHHSSSAIPFAEMIAELRSGDILTHLYHPRANSPFTEDEARPTAAVIDARERGVVMDVGHGVGSFSWDVAERACQEYDFWPDTISTDIHQFGLETPVVDLPTTLSKFLYLGMPIERVIQAATAKPAEAMRLQATHGHLQVDRQADVVVMKIEDGQFELADVHGSIRVANKRLVPTTVFKSGKRMLPD